MKANELMIGDIVMAHFDDGEQEFDFPVVIDGLDENGTLVDGSCYFSWHNMLTEHNSLEYADELSSIPLTEEILEANKLEKVEGWHDLYRIKVYVCYDYEHQSMVMLVNDLSWPICDVETVDEMQRFLRSLGENKLADNFKLK